MQILILPDKFKGFLTAQQVCTAIENGIRAIKPNVKITAIPLADGGEGTLDVFIQNNNAKTIKTTVHDPLFRPINSKFGYINETAYIEMAQASGLQLLQPTEINCYFTTSIGTGELIKSAIDIGAKKIIMGIGGSATNDGGIGMATALGYKFLDKNGNELQPIGKNLINIHHIDNTNYVSKNITIQVACDVNNPLYGTTGAVQVYAAQKGANLQERHTLEAGLINLAKIIQQDLQINVNNLKFAGAAGGLGAGAFAFLNASLEQGTELIFNNLNLADKLQTTDLIFTGEGKIDEQTLHGKLVKGIIDIANDIPVICMCGILDLKNPERLGAKHIVSLDSNIPDQMELLQIATAKVFQKYL